MQTPYHIAGIYFDLLLDFKLIGKFKSVTYVFNHFPLQVPSNLLVQQQMQLITLYSLNLELMLSQIIEFLLWCEFLYLGGTI